MKSKKRIRSVSNTLITSNAVRTAELQSVKFHLSQLEIFFNLCSIYPRKFSWLIMIISKKIPMSYRSLFFLFFVSFFFFISRLYRM